MSHMVEVASLDEVPVREVGRMRLMTSRRGWLRTQNISARHSTWILSLKELRLLSGPSLRM